MHAESRLRRTWLACLFVALALVCAAGFLRIFWPAAFLRLVTLGGSDAASDGYFPQLEFDQALQFLGDPKSSAIHRAAAADVLRRSGSKAIPDLIRLLHVDSPQVQISAVNLLGALGRDAAGAGPKIRTLCEHSDPDLRLAAIHASWNVHPNRRILHEPLARALALGPEANATVAMKHLMTLEAPCVDEIYPIAEGKVYTSLQWTAATYLAHVAKKDPALLRRMLKSRMRFSAPSPLRKELQGIVESEPDDEIHLTALLRLLYPAVFTDKSIAERNLDFLIAGATRHRDAPDSFELCHILGGFDVRGLPSLRVLLTSIQPQTRCLAAYYITTFDPRAVDVLPVLREGLTAGGPWTSNAVDGLKNLGRSEVEEAIPDLQSVARGKDPYAARRALELLKEWRLPLRSP